MLIYIYPLVPVIINGFATNISFSLIYPSIALLLNEKYHSKGFILIVPINNFFNFLVPILIAVIRNYSNNYSAALIFLIAISLIACILAIVLQICFKRQLGKTAKEGDLV